MGILSAALQARSTLLLCVLAAPAIGTQAGCAHIKPAGAREVAKERETGRSITEAELKSSLQRLTQTYFDRSAEAIESMEPSLPVELRDTLLRRVLVYDSSVLSIASGPVPAVNMLDMLVFTRLTRETFETYWAPKVFGNKGQPLLDVLCDAEADVWSTASSMLTDEQSQRLNAMIEAWKKANPDRTRVELVRFEQFAKIVGEAEYNKAASGALGSVKVMGQVADAAVLLAERAMFVGQFMPSILRLQARLGALEIANDGVLMLGSHGELTGSAASLLERSQQLVDSMQQLTQRTEGMAPMLEQAVLLSQNLERVTQEAHGLSDSLGPLSAQLSPLFEREPDGQGRPVLAIERVLRESNELTQRSLNLVEQVQKLVPQNEKAGGPLDVLRGDLEGAARKLTGYLLLLGLGWATFFWGGYYLVRRRLDARAARPPTDVPPHGHRPRPSVT